MMECWDWKIGKMGYWGIGVMGKKKEVEKIRRLKASIPYVHTNSNRLYDILHFAAFVAASVHLKKPSRWPKA
jgi:hypothetical protein